MRARDLGQQIDQKIKVKKENKRVSSRSRGSKYSKVKVRSIESDQVAYHKKRPRKPKRDITKVLEIEKGERIREV